MGLCKLPLGPVFFVAATRARCVVHLRWRYGRYPNWSLGAEARFYSHYLRSCVDEKTGEDCIERALRMALRDANANLGSAGYDKVKRLCLFVCADDVIALQCSLLLGPFLPSNLAFST